MVQSEIYIFEKMEQGKHFMETQHVAIIIALK